MATKKATKAAPKKKATAKKTPAKKAAKKPAAKKAAKKPAAKKAAKKTAAGKTAKKPAAKKATSTTTKQGTAPVASAKAATPVVGHILPGTRKPLDLSSLAASYRDGGDAMAHPVTAEQMAEVSHDGLRGDSTILHVEDDAGLAPCRLVDHGEGRYSLCLDDFRMPKVAIFDERGLQGGGYTWEAVADSLARLRRPELVDGVGYDSEASMFVAIGTRPTLIALAHLIQEALDDETLLRAAVDAADPDRLE